MKRIISLLLTFVLLIISTVALADEPFTLHSKTHFGMNKQEVRMTELEAGYLFFDYDDKIENCLYGEAEIAGRNYVGGVQYRFEDDKLYQMRYIFYLDLFSGFNQDDYNAIDNALTTKYGTTEYNSVSGKSIPVKPLYYTKDGYPYNIPITGKSIAGTVYDLSPGGDYTFIYHFRSDCNQYKQWLIIQDDGSSIVIDHSYMTDNKQAYTDTYTGDIERQNYEQIIYTLLSPEETKKLLSSQEKVFDDL